ncbi:hypothetical protein O9992_19770 [Vibrio lentus]|nr:hypothetical protein [Vibrio lentus]
MSLNVGCLRSHHQPTGNFLPYRHIRGRWHVAVEYRVFFGRFPVASFATGASFAARHGNGDGLRLAHACDALSVAVYVKVTSLS